MVDLDLSNHPVLNDMVETLRRSAGDRLQGVVLYGSAARGDYHAKTSDYNLLVVVADLEPSTLETLTVPFAAWRKKRQPEPRVFSPALIAAAEDVFPIEFLDITAHSVVLYGEDPLAGVELHTDHLRLQCERELREKMMRLREGYIGLHPKPRELEALLTKSYTTFVALFRGCLHVLGGAVPTHNDEVVEAFCRVAGLDPAPFRDVDRLKRGEDVPTPPREMFSGYYAQLERAVDAVDRYRSSEGDAKS